MGSPPVSPDANLHPTGARAFRTSDDSVLLPPEELIRAAYGRLHEIARARVRREAPDQMLQATALVHEAYLRLLKEEKEGWSMRQFLAAAAEAMRRILVEQTRAQRRLKRSGRRRREPLSGVAIAVQRDEIDLLALDEALDELASEDPRSAQIVMLRFFGGLEMAEIAEVLGISSRTADRDWRCARVWLFERIRGGGGGG